MYFSYIVLVQNFVSGARVLSVISLNDVILINVNGAMNLVLKANKSR